MRRKIDAPEPKVATAILRAKKLIEAKGWVRGALCNDAGYCITGAIIAATTDRDVQDLAFECVRKECGSKFAVQWNDTVAASKSEVMKMMVKAAARARALRSIYNGARDASL